MELTVDQSIFLLGNTQEFGLSSSQKEECQSNIIKYIFQKETATLKKQWTTDYASLAHHIRNMEYIKGLNISDITVLWQQSKV